MYNVVFLASRSPTDAFPKTEDIHDQFILNKVSDQILLLLPHPTVIQEPTAKCQTQSQILSIKLFAAVTLSLASWHLILSDSENRSYLPNAYLYTYYRLHSNIIKVLRSFGCKYATASFMQFDFMFIIYFTNILT